MASYSIEWAQSAVKEFHKLAKADKTAFIHKIAALATNPRPQGSVKLEGVEDTYRIRHGNFRFVHKIADEALIALIVRVAHRKHS